MADETMAIRYNPQQLLEHWLGHRRLTHKTIEAYPSNQLFSFSVGGMRSFGVLVHEFLGMALPVANQVATGTWGDTESSKPTTKPACSACGMITQRRFVCSCRRSPSSVTKHE